MSWLSNLWHGKTPTEADVLNFIAKVHEDEDLAYTWITTNGPSLIKDLQVVMAVIGTLASGDPRVAAAVTALNLATTAINALVAAKSLNESVWQAVADAYKALKNAQSAQAQAALAVL